MENWLTKKNTVLILFGIGLVGVGIDYYDVLNYTLADPINNLAFAFLTVSFLLLSARDRVFSSWLAFAKWWIPLTVLLIILSPTDGSSAFFPALFSKELTSMWMSGLFVVISLFIIAYKSFTSRKDGVGK